MFKIVTMIIYTRSNSSSKIILLKYFAPSSIQHELSISHLLHRLNYTSSNHLDSKHTVQPSDEYGGCAIIFMPSSVKQLIMSE